MSTIASYIAIALWYTKLLTFENLYTELAQLKIASIVTTASSYLI